MSIAISMFGPEYVDAAVMDFGVFEVFGDSTQSIKPTDIRDTTQPGLTSLLLPPGGYIIKYINGAFLLLNGEPAVFVVGGSRGMQTEWKSSIGHNWTSVSYPIKTEVVNAEAFKSINMSNLDNLFYLEFTTPHRLRLVPPSGSAGCVRVHVWRYVPTVLSGQ